MIDTALSLAISVQSSPGVYALLLGSGVSRSSSVPTGWEIVEDLIRRLSLLKGEACDPDPRAWYRDTFAREPDYSELLNEVAKSPAERMQLLRGYFEPTEEQRLQGLKLPTPAHRSIAELVAKRYIRVLVTTNFDRLLESALADIGIQPVVVSTGDAACGALPLAHSPCTIIKVNGDYLDTRLRNTSDELSSYDESTERLVNQVLDEYGLIVCGWSGEWDIALRLALERCASRRFTTYWANKGELSQQARNLAVLRQAAVLTIAEADQFFKDLLDNVTALESMKLTDVLSAKVAVARMKRYLADSTQKINLYDLLTSETEKAHAVLIRPEFATVNAMNLPFEGMRRLVSAYEGALETLLRLAICGTFWGTEDHDDLLLRCYKRVADLQVLLSPPTPELARYPGLFLLYGIGLSACAAQNYRLLYLLFRLKVRSVSSAPHKENIVAQVVCQAYVLDRYSQAQVFGGKYMCEHLFLTMREPLREYVPSDYDYDQIFDWFEYLACLCHCDASVTRSTLVELKTKDPNFILMASIGRFGLSPRSSLTGRSGIQAETDLRKGEPYPEKVAAVLRAGFFESGGRLQEDKYRDVKAAFDRFVLEYRQGLHPML